MTETPTDKKLSERFGGFSSAEQQERAVFMDAFDAAAAIRARGEEKENG